jgi:hypothetical protein
MPRPCTCHWSRTCDGQGTLRCMGCSIVDEGVCVCSCGGESTCAGCSECEGTPDFEPEGYEP